MSEREKQLETALLAFLKLNWWPEGAPGPGYYMVDPVWDVHRALAVAYNLLSETHPVGWPEGMIPPEPAKPMPKPEPGKDDCR